MLNCNVSGILEHVEGLEPHWKGPQNSCLTKHTLKQSTSSLSMSNQTLVVSDFTLCIRTGFLFAQLSAQNWQSFMATGRPPTSRCLSRLLEARHSTKICCRRHSLTVKKLSRLTLGMRRDTTGETVWGRPSAHNFCYHSLQLPDIRWYTIKANYSARADAGIFLRTHCITCSGQTREGGRKLWRLRERAWREWKKMGFEMFKRMMMRQGKRWDREG